MKRILLAVLFLSTVCFGQGVSFTGTALKSVNGNTTPFPGASITVCAANVSGTPCAPSLSGVLFQDTALTIPLANPFNTDLNGNYTFSIAPGSYTVTISGTGFAGYSYQITAQCPLNGTCVWTGTMVFNGPTSLLSPVITNPQTTGADVGVETLQNKTLQGVTFSGTITGNLALVNKITSYNNLSTVSNGVPSLLAKVDATAQAANIGATLLYAVPAGGAGFYRASCYVVVTQAATTSSTMPNCAVTFTDNDTNTTSSGVQFTNGSAGNTVGTNSAVPGSIGSTSGSIIFNAKLSTNINYSTLNYASVGGTVMQYAVHIKLEYLGL